MSVSDREGQLMSLLVNAQQKWHILSVQRWMYKYWLCKMFLSFPVTDDTLLMTESQKWRESKSEASFSQVSCCPQQLYYFQLLFSAVCRNPVCWSEVFSFILTVFVENGDDGAIHLSISSFHFGLCDNYHIMQQALGLQPKQPRSHQLDKNVECVLRLQNIF